MTLLRPSKRLVPILSRFSKPSRRDLLRYVGSGLVAAPLLRAQDAPATFSSNVRVVNVFATVHDKKGKLISDLGQSDFHLTEEGRPQTIRYFARETDLPLTIGFLVDTSLSTRLVLPEERAAAQSFVNQNLRQDKDQAFVIHFDREVELLRDLTGSKPKLTKALGELEASDWRSNSNNDGGGSGDWGRGRLRGRFGTHLFDAVLLASDEILSKRQGRKAIILISDGGDRGSKTTLMSAIAAAEKAEALVYSIYFKGETFGGYGQRGAWGGRRGRYPMPQSGAEEEGKNIMQRLARDTGGAFYEITKRHPVDKAFAQIEEELRNQYSLGYTPENPGSAGEFRRITVTTSKPDLSVQARNGYFVI